MNEENVAHTCNKTLFIHKEKWCTDADVMWTVLVNIVLNKEKKTEIKVHILHESIYMKYSKLENT